MTVKQLSIFVENKPGRLARVTDILAKGGIDIRALSVADTTDYGILRLIVSDPIKACELLKGAEYTVKLTDVIVVELEDEVGALARMLALLDSHGISVEYLYAFIGRDKGKAYIIIRVEDNIKAVDILSGNGYSVTKEEEIYKI